MAEKCESYEAHMQAVRDYLEERLVVSACGPGPGDSERPRPGAPGTVSARGPGPWGQ